MMRFASICDGIGAAPCAWVPLGWRFVFKSEIEPFPIAVTHHHFPDVPNHGDMTRYQDWPDHELDLICGGTPCQAFSVAGLRKGLADPRGNLTLTFLAIVARYRPQWVVWENVPGVLSDQTGAFGAFLGGLGELGYGFAYRILDAQYFGVAQRRRRVFVVGHAGGLWQRAAAVLFERASLCGHPAPRREQGERPSGTVSARTQGGGGLGTDHELDGGVVTEPITFPWQQGGTLGMSGTLVKNQTMAVAMNLRGREGGAMPEMDEVASLRAASGGSSRSYVTHSLRADGFDASEDGTGRGTPLVPEVAWALQERDSKGCDSDTKDGHLIPMPNMAVRRLTPRECERLQGFPDDWTAISYRGKPAADGPRYKALGNSMAVPVMRWIGERIAQVEVIPA